MMVKTLNINTIISLNNVFFKLHNSNEYVLT